MKKLLLILLCLPLLFTTCKKEDNQPISSTNNSGTIIGKWHLIEMDFKLTDGYFTNYPNGKVIETIDSGNCVLPGYAQIIEADNSPTGVTGPMWLESAIWDFTNIPVSPTGKVMELMEK